MRTAALSRFTAPVARPSTTRQTFARLASSPDLDADNRTINYVFSDESVGRDNHVIKTAGWQLDNFRANPVFLFSHRDDQPPIGRVSYINQVGSELRGAVRYATADEYPFAEFLATV